MQGAIKMKIEEGMNPGDVTAGMTLIHVKPEYMTNTKDVHWSGADEEDFPPGFIESAIGEKSILAIWKGVGRFVIAWVE
jgi:hypothetical protein